MIALTVVDRKTNQLSKLLKGKTKRLKREVAIAVNATAKKTTSLLATEVGKQLSTAKKNIKKTISIAKKADPKTGTRMTAIVRQSKTGRIPLRDFKARQNKKGVSYRISKSSGRGFAEGAFQGPKPGVVKASWRGRVFKRVGKARLPIIQLFGASPWGVVKKHTLDKKTKKASKIELEKQLERRIRFLKLKQSGAI
jgi:hypothetical protein